MDFGRPEFARSWRIVPTILLIALPLALASAATATEPVRNGRVVFFSDRAEALAYPNIYSVSPRGGKVVLVARDAQLPVVSRDGRRLAFLRDRSIVVVELAHPGRAQILVRGGRGPYNVPTDLSWSPAGDALAYTTMPDGGRRTLWVVKRGAPRPMRVAELDADLSVPPTWSPDGTKLAFARTVLVGELDRTSLAIANLVSGRVRPVPNTGGGEQPAWSPDGRRIAFVRWIAWVAGSPSHHALTLIRPDGSGRRTVARDACAPDWSPEGTRLAVHQCSVGGGAVGVVRLGTGKLQWLTKEEKDGFEGTWDARGAWLVGWQAGDLVALDPSTIGLRRVLKAGTKKFALASERPAIVRTGGRVLFVAVDHPREPYGLYTVAPDGTGVRQFGAGAFGQPAWARDGQLAVVVPGGAIAIMDARGKVQRLLTSGFSPAWSPDGTEIAFARDVDPGEKFDQHVFVIPSRGGEARELGPGSDPSWASDGDRIAVGRDDGELWAYPAEGAEPTRLTHMRDPTTTCPSQSASDPAWSPDGRKIVFVQTSVNCFNRGYLRLAVLDVATGATRSFVKGRESEWEVAPAWSPDGRFLAYGTTSATITRRSPASAPTEPATARSIAGPAKRSLQPGHPHDHAPLKVPANRSLLGRGIPFISRPRYRKGPLCGPCSRAVNRRVLLPVLPPRAARAKERATTPATGSCS